MKKEEAEKLGIRIKPVKHSMKRRASWHDYRRRGVYLVTICIKTMDADGGYFAGTLLSRIEGDSRLLPPGTYEVGGRLGGCGDRDDDCDGEREIFYEALEQGCRCIKLQASPLPRKAHPQDKDIILCAQGQLLVLGPWEIDGDVYRTADGREISKESFYARFHNLNEMARRLCEEPIGEMAWREYE